MPSSGLSSALFHGDRRSSRLTSVDRIISTALPFKFPLASFSERDQADTREQGKEGGDRKPKRQPERKSWNVFWL